MKIVFIGHPGSGKTYAATTLAKGIGTQVIDIDILLDNWVYFYFKKPYRRAFHELLKGKNAWILDGYAGRRMPASVWDEADRIVYIDLPKSELRQNVLKRYRSKKTNQETTHGQHLFMNVLKNFWQIYILDHSLQRCVKNIRRSANAGKISEVRSRQELNDLIESISP